MSETPLELAWLEYGGAEIPPHHGWVKVKCVLHADRNASAQVNLEIGKWRCFAGCGYGDIYDLIGIHENIRDFPDQKRFAEEKGWRPEELLPPAPSLMNPNPRSKQAKGKKAKWKPSWT